MVVLGKFLLRSRSTLMRSSKTRIRFMYFVKTAFCGFLIPSPAIESGFLFALGAVLLSIPDQGMVLALHRDGKCDEISS